LKGWQWLPTGQNAIQRKKKQQQKGAINAAQHSRKHKHN
jgi:hypothetical protein